jgi:prolyl-tRNA synthetase
LKKVRGIEIGNIFQLGKKYTDSMHVTYTAADGSEQTPIMGCYGIGVGRTMAAIIEESADDNGPIWNMETAPFAVEVIGLVDKENKTLPLAEKIYGELKNAGIEVLLDNRDNRAGEKFADADLVAAPIRVIVSQKNLEQNKLEIKYRVNNYDTSKLPTALDVDDYLNPICDLITELKKH